MKIYFEYFKQLNFKKFMSPRELIQILGKKELIITVFCLMISAPLFLLLMDLKIGLRFIGYFPQAFEYELFYSASLAILIAILAICASRFSDRLSARLRIEFQEYKSK